MYLLFFELWFDCNTGFSLNVTHLITFKRDNNHTFSNSFSSYLHFTINTTHRSYASVNTCDNQGKQILEIFIMWQSLQAIKNQYCVKWEKDCTTTDYSCVTDAHWEQVHVARSWKTIFITDELLASLTTWKLLVLKLCGVALVWNSLCSFCAWFQITSSFEIKYTACQCLLERIIKRDLDLELFTNRYFGFTLQWHRKHCSITGKQSHIYMHAPWTHQTIIARTGWSYLNM